MVRHWKLGGAERDFWGEKSKNIQHEIVVEIRRRDKSHQRHADMQILFFLMGESRRAVRTQSLCSVRLLSLVMAEVLIFTASFLISRMYNEQVRAAHPH